MTATTADSGGEAGSSKMLDAIERMGNKVPHPVIMFLYLIGFIAVLSAVLAWADVSVTENVAIPVPRAQLEDVNNALGGSIVPYDVYTQTQVTLPDYVIEEQTFAVESLLSTDGIRFIFSSFVNNFAAFAVVAVAPAALITARIVEPRLGVYDPSHGELDAVSANLEDADALAAEARGLKFAFRGFLLVVLVVVALTAPSGAPLREPTTGAIVGATPFMASLIFIISLLFLGCGIAYGIGAIVALMLPYVLGILIAWLALFVLWVAVGIPLGPGSPVGT